MSRFNIIHYIKKILDPSMPRLGPGNSELTKKALNMVLPVITREKKGGLRVLDIGCGYGAQTMELAAHLNEIITAIDIHQPFLDELQRRAERNNFSDKIRPCLGDMNNLGMKKESFDLVWAEGSLYHAGEGPLYHAGFEKGLGICRDLLVPGGGLGASEMSWLRPDPPEECRKFFADIYPDMVDIESNLETIRNNGFDIIGHFTLPEAAWWEPFYHPLEKRLAVLREQYASDQDWIEVLDSFQHEIDIFSRYSKYYGSVFFVMKRC
jgi:SAM-dependent methyltransferase